jgi:hypothetical protein
MCATYRTASQPATGAPSSSSSGRTSAPHAFIDLRRAGLRSGAGSLKLDRGGVLVFTERRPHSVYFSYPSASNQVEVFAPSGATARSLVLSGEITPIR